MACAKPFQRVLKYGDVRVVVPLPCGYCAACRRDKINMWSDRLAFEAIGKPSSFLTLTYDDDHLPKDKSVHLEDWQEFHNRLRHRKGVPPYKYFVTSEYGELNFRPHMHVCLIGIDWQDWNQYKAISECWDKGFFAVSTLNRTRIRYCLKYMHKELRGKLWNDYELRGLKPLFHTMSRGIGRDFFFKNIDSIREHKGYYRDGKLRPLPRYYSELLKLRDDMTLSDWLEYTKKYKDKVSPTYSPLFGSVYRDELFSDMVKLNHLEKQENLDDLNTLV